MTAPEDYDREETRVPQNTTVDESNEPALDPYEDDDSEPMRAGDQDDVTL